jgi:phosphoglycolate phosphatase
MPMVRLVLFDIDGTLILTGGAGERAFAKVCATVFEVPNGTQNLGFAGRTDMAIVRDFFRNHGIEPSLDNFQEFFDSYVFWLDQMLDRRQGCVLPGIQRWLQDLKNLSPPPALGLLTGNTRLGAQIKLTHYHLWNHFQTGAFGDECEDRNELAVLAGQRGSRILGERLTGEDILVVGDTPLDIDCARAIGAMVLAVATGSYSLTQLQRHQPTWLVENMEQIQAADVCSHG